jgi:fructose-1-phosphate kinase PfkB-like protein
MAFLTVCLNPTLQKTLIFPSVIPGTVNRTAVHRLDVSGKGINVTRVLIQLGKKAVHLTQLGGMMRELFLSLCEQDRLSVEWAESESRIRFCYTVLTECDGGVTELVEEAEKVAAGTEERLLEKFDALLEGKSFGQAGTSADMRFKWLIVSGTKAAGFSDTVIPDMVRRAKEKGLHIILDIKGKDLKECLQYQPDIVKPNLYEFASTFTPELIKDNDLAALDAAAKEYIKSAMLDITRKYGCSVILTNGSREIWTADRGGFLKVPIQSVKAVNSIGCGDAFTAGLAAALDEGANLNEAIANASRCGAMNAALIKPGVIR